MIGTSPQKHTKTTDSCQITVTL